MVFLGFLHRKPIFVDSFIKMDAVSRFPASRAWFPAQGSISSLESLDRSAGQPRWCQMLPDAARWCQMLPDAAGGSQMPPDATELQDASRWYQVLPDAARWSQMSQMIPDAARCCQPRCRQMPDAGWCYQYQLQCQYQRQHKCQYKCQHQPQYQHQYQYKYQHITKNNTHTDLGCFPRVMSSLEVTRPTDINSTTEFSRFVEDICKSIGTYKKL